MCDVVQQIPPLSHSGGITLITNPNFGIVRRCCPASCSSTTSISLSPSSTPRSSDTLTPTPTSLEVSPQPLVPRAHQLTAVYPPLTISTRTHRLYRLGVSTDDDLFSFQEPNCDHDDFHSSVTPHTDEAATAPHPPTAVAPPTAEFFLPSSPAVMCCYFKQKGFCKMGALCWYPHEGTLETPCHYGAACRAGHATLTTQPPLAPVRESSSKVNAAAALHHQQQQQQLMSTLSSPLMCIHCGAAAHRLGVRKIPVWDAEGQCVMRWRASCFACQRAFLIDA